MIYAAKKRFNSWANLKILGQWKTNTSLCRRSMISSKMMLIPLQPLFFQMKLLSDKTFHGTKALNILMNYVQKTWLRSYNSLQLLSTLQTRDFNTSFLPKSQDGWLNHYFISFLSFLRQCFDRLLPQFLYPANPFLQGRWYFYFA